MYTPATLTACFAGLIGFEQSYNTDHPAIDADLVQSASSLTVNSHHPLLTYDNILAVAEQFEQVNVKPWVSGLLYFKGNIVKSGSDIFQSLIDSNTNPVVEGSSWRKTNLLSAYLRKTYDASVVKLFASVIAQKKLGEVAKSLLGNVTLFEGTGNINGRIPKSNRFVGFKISLQSPDLVAKIHSIGLQLDTAQNPVTLYLFHTSSDEPVKTWAINHTKSIAFQWHPIETQALNFMSDDLGRGGAYYLGYYESDITGNAIKKDLVWTGSTYCGTCSEAVLNARRYNQRSSYVNIQPFYVNGSTPGVLWDETSEMLINDSNFGINLQISVQCDISNWVCQNTEVFTSALAQQLTFDILTQMAFSLRENRLKAQVAALAATALDNREGGEFGEQKKLVKEIEAMSFDLSRVNSICLPCSKRDKVTQKSVWT